MLIVIIDDDQEVASALSEMLELEGFTVAVFYSAEQALQTLNVDSPVIILSDVRMPKMGGLSLLGQIQKLDSALPVILMSGHVISRWRLMRWKRELIIFWKNL